ncbi:MAG: hypothetical protein IKU73_04745, partial [Clostridia bacterium]|nr:hypothetical protein [Clostridia bacterium]
MKSILRVLVLCLLVVFASAALADDAASCYWLLEEIRVESLTSDAYGPASAETDVQPVSGLKPAAMTEAVRGMRSFELDVTRAAGGQNAHAEYTLSGMPAVVPGAASARMTITASTSADEDSFYLYSAIFAGQYRTLRVRGTGAWVHRVRFPRTAESGSEQTVSFVAREIHDLARTEVTYVYRAHPGVMMVDMNGDVVLYDLDGNEIDRIVRTVDDILPEFTQNLGGDIDGKTLFAGEMQDDGSLIVSFDPESGLTEDELIRLLRAAKAAEQPADAASAATAVSPLTADKDNATIYLAADADLSDD